MNRIIHDLIQGSPEWHAFRANHYGASEASAVVGISPYKTRDALLHEKHTGLSPEINGALQKVFDNGHAVEAAARPIVEKLIGVDLYPVTMSYGKLSASCDGLSMDETIAWENKQFNQAHYDQVLKGELPDIHVPQCQQVLYVTGAERLYFTVSDGTEEKTAGIWVYPDETAIKQIIFSWDQFEKDLAAYVPTVIAEPAKAQPIIALPSLSIAIKGEVTLSNLPEFKKAATAYIEGINTKLVSDDDFANGEAAVKFCKNAEDTIEITKQSAIAQTASIDELMRTLDFIKEQFRTKRLELDKLVKSQKEKIKLEAINKAKGEVLSYSEAADAEIAPLKLWANYPDFAGAISGLKSIKSMHSTLNDCVAKAKIEIDAMARDIRAKQKWFKDSYEEYNYLFTDMQLVIQKPFDDFTLNVKSRVEAFLDDQAKRKSEKVEPEPAVTRPIPSKEFQTRSPSAAAKIDAPKPTADEIAHLVASHFGVAMDKALEWLAATDFRKVPF